MSKRIDRLSSFVVCPVCLSELESIENRLRCGDCDVAFPVIRSTPEGMPLPLLVCDPHTYAAGEKIFLDQYSQQHRAAAESYRESASREGLRQTTLLRIAEALDHNAGLLSTFADSLPVEDGPLGEYTSPGGIDLFGALRRDWSGAQEAEEELKAGLDALLSVMRPNSPKSILVLGAGVGRRICDLAEDCPVVVGVDLSFTMASAFQWLCDREELTAYQLLTGNFHRAADECERIDARRDRADGDPIYVIGDATRLPFEAEQFDAVVSDYFTDIVPLSNLLPEVARVLRPTGRFYHFGPLGYAFPDHSEHYAIDEIPEVFASHDFTVEHQEFVETTLFGSQHRISQLMIQNLLLVARR